MVLFGIIGLIRINWYYSGKIDIIRAKVVLFRQKLLFSGKRGSNPAKLLYSGKRSCIREKVNVFGRNWFYFGKNG